MLFSQYFPSKEKGIENVGTYICINRQEVRFIKQFNFGNSIDYFISANYIANYICNICNIYLFCQYFYMLIT